MLLVILLITHGSVVTGSGSDILFCLLYIRPVLCYYYLVELDEA